MRNLDVKKLLVFIAIIAVIALAVVFSSKQFLGEKKPSEEETKKVEELVTTYFGNLTYGSSTNYTGREKLYAKDKITISDLNLNNIFNTSMKYAISNGLNINVANGVINEINRSGKYGDVTECLFYNAEGIKQAAKELFGIELNEESSINEFEYLYDFIYVYEYDLYLVKRNNVTDLSSSEYGIDYKFVKTTKKEKDIMTTIAVAYTLKNGNTRTFAKDSKGENIVAENLEKFPEDKIDEFTKYTITLTKTDDGNYIFKSIEKVK